MSLGWDRCLQLLLELRLLCPQCPRGAAAGGAGTPHGSRPGAAQQLLQKEILHFYFKGAFKKELHKEKPSRRKAFPKPACDAAPNKMSQMGISSPGFSVWGLSLCWEGVPIPRETPRGAELGLAATSTASTPTRNSPRAD